MSQSVVVGLSFGEKCNFAHPVAFFLCGALNKTKKNKRNGDSQHDDEDDNFSFEMTLT